MGGGLTLDKVNALDLKLFVGNYEVIHQRKSDGGNYEVIHHRKSDGGNCGLTHKVEVMPWRMMTILFTYTM